MSLKTNHKCTLSVDPSYMHAAAIHATVNWFMSVHYMTHVKYMYIHNTMMSIILIVAKLH